MNFIDSVIFFFLFVVVSIIVAMFIIVITTLFDGILGKIKRGDRNR